MAKNDQDDDIPQDEQTQSSIAVNDAWTGMLAISLFALIVGTGFLAWDYMSYYDADVPKTPKYVSSLPKELPKAEPAKDGGAKN